ncbi:unnamed protein product [Penicillium salamii]|nr:unnamed protein product [Penicillium salamii]
MGSPTSPSQTQKPLRLIVAGLSRTGTASLYLALQELGYTPWHMCKPVDNPKLMYTQWTDAMKRKFFNSAYPYDREDFDRLRGKYDALLDIPACLFWDDFHRLYPEVKIILTSRSADSWFKSVSTTIIPWLQKPLLNIVQYFEPTRLGPEFCMVKTAYRVICNNDYSGDFAKKRFMEHNDRVRKGVSPERFLELQLGDGWKPLCEFLDVPVPKIPYPRVNNSNEFNQGADQADRAVLKGLLMTWLACGTLIPAILLGLLCWKTGYIITF